MIVLSESFITHEEEEIKEKYDLIISPCEWLFPKKFLEILLLLKATNLSLWD